MAVLESTGHYLLGLVTVFQENGYEVIILNPLISQRARKSKLRKVKTDAENAKHLAELYYKEELESNLLRQNEQSELRFLSRQHEMISNSYVQAKLNFQSILDQLFPLFMNIFGQLFSHTALEVLRKYPTPSEVLLADVDQIRNTIQLYCNRSQAWAASKADAIREAAHNSLIKNNSSSCRITELRLIIDLLIQYQKHLTDL